MRRSSQKLSRSLLEVIAAELVRYLFAQRNAMLEIRQYNLRLITKKGPESNGMSITFMGYFSSVNSE